MPNLPNFLVWLASKDIWGRQEIQPYKAFSYRIVGQHIAEIRHQSTPKTRVFCRIEMLRKDYKLAELFHAKDTRTLAPGLTTGITNFNKKEIYRLRKATHLIFLRWKNIFHRTKNQVRRLLHVKVISKTCLTFGSTLYI